MIRFQPGLRRISNRLILPHRKPHPAYLGSDRHVATLPAAVSTRSEEITRQASESDANLLSESRKREAIKHLTDSLLRSQQVIPVSRPRPLNVPVRSTESLEEGERPDSREIRLLMELQQWLRYFSARSQENVLQQSTEPSKPTVHDQASAGSEKLEQHDNTSERRPHRQQAESRKRDRSQKVPSFFERSTVSPPRPHPNIYDAIRRGHHVKAMRLYNAALQNDQELDAHVLHALFQLLVTRQEPFAAHTVLQHYRQLTPSSQSIHASLYERLCDSMRHMNPAQHEYQAIHRLTRSVVHRVLKLDRDGQQLCVPVLVSAIAMQRAMRVGQYASRLYQYMIEQNFSVRDGYWEHLLSMSKYNRQKDLPFAEILQKSVAVGWRSNPITVLHALENMYPFADPEEACIAMRAIADLQRQESDDGREYRIDLATLEALSSAAAQSANLQMLMLVWELIDLYQYKPTVALFENTVMGFASHQETYGNAFAAISEMIAQGITVSRALTRGVSTKLRNSLDNVDLALNHLQSLDQDEIVLAAEHLNCIMSAIAERGDLTCLGYILDEFDRLGLSLNADSFSFAMEALGKHLYRARKQGVPSQDTIRACLEQASQFLTAMDESGVAPTRHIIREYVELLCQADEVDAATEVVLESLDNGGDVNDKTLYRVAMAQAEQSNFDAARKVAAHLSERLPEVVHNINRIEHESLRLKPL